MRDNCTFACRFPPSLWRSTCWRPDTLAKRCHAAEPGGWWCLNPIWCSASLRLGYRAKNSEFQHFLRWCFIFFVSLRLITCFESVPLTERDVVLNAWQGGLLMHIYYIRCYTDRGKQEIHIHAFLLTLPAHLPIPARLPSQSFRRGCLSLLSSLSASLPISVLPSCFATCTPQVKP